ncbi:MAG: glycosyltransferase family 2 protein [Candidatus Aenigmatarchaeota archaeon]
MDNMPLVSVGIPTYNRPQGLKKTLECITNQTYTNLEIIVSDNCSSDPQVKEIIEAFTKKDKRIKYYRQETNIGPTKNFEFVLKQSTGEYFMWACDDDEWENSYIFECIRVFMKERDAVAVTTACYFVHNPTKGDRIVVKNLNTLGINSFVEKVKIFIHYMYNSPNTSFYSIYKSDILKTCRLKNYFGSDWGFILQVLQYGDFVSSTNKVLYTYFYSGISSGSLDDLKKYLQIKSMFHKYFFVSLHLPFLLIEIYQLKMISFWDRIKAMIITVYLYIRKRIYFLQVAAEISSLFKKIIHYLSQKLRKLTTLLIRKFTF